MRLGIIGSGMIVREFLPELVRMDALSVQALLCTPRSLEQAEQLAVQYGIGRVVTSMQALCRLELDAVYVAVPNALHFSYCKQALEAGLHVIVEKPLAANEQEALALARIAREQGRFLFEAVTTLSMESYAVLRAWLPRIGQVRQVLCNFAQYSSRYDAFQAGQTAPVFQPAMAGGVLHDLNVYNLHLVMGLFGSPQRVQYTAHVERGVDLSGVVLLQYPGFCAICAAAKDSAAPSYFVFQGSEGWLSLDRAPNAMGGVRLCLRDGTEEHFVEPMAAQRAVPEFYDFVRAIRAHDTGFWESRMQQSLAVSHVMTLARRDAGIRFPSDEQSLFG